MRGLRGLTGLQHRNINKTNVAPRLPAGSLDVMARKNWVSSETIEKLYQTLHTTYQVLFNQDKNDKFAATTLDYGGGGVVVCGIVTIPPYHNYPGLSTEH